MSDTSVTDWTTRLPKQCPAPTCTATRFQKGPEGSGSFNVRCDSGHILALDYYGLLEVRVVGFQARNTRGLYGEPRQEGG